MVGTCPLQSQLLNCVHFKRQRVPEEQHLTILQRLLKHLANPWVSWEESFKNPHLNPVQGTKYILGASLALNPDQAVLGGQWDICPGSRCVLCFLCLWEGSAILIHLFTGVRVRKGRAL